MSAFITRSTLGLPTQGSVRKDNFPNTKKPNPNHEIPTSYLIYAGKIISLVYNKVGARPTNSHHNYHVMD